MGQTKALLPWRRGTFLSGSIRLLTAHADLVIVVAGRNSKGIEPIADANAAYLVVNHDPDRGQFSSLQLGLQEVLNRGRDTAIVTLVDRPPARPETVQHLRNQYLNLICDNQIWAVVPEFEGKHGHPIIVGRELMGLIIDAPASSNARDIMHANQSHIAYLPVTDPFVTMNIDTPEDYERLCAFDPETPVTR
jgi:CTP:molybdopterin cytidylyltransferase MocA